MGPITVKTTIDSPRERVYEILCDLANRPAFTDHFVADYRLQRLDSSGVGAAARFRVTEPGLWMETVIDEVSPPHRVHEQGAGGGGIGSPSRPPGSCSSPRPAGVR